MNQYELIGRIGNDAEVKTLSKSKVLSFNMAIDRSYYDKAKKEKVTQVEWIRINKFFDLQNAINVAQYLKKGTLVYVSGIPKAEAWINNEGQAQAALSLTGRDIKILASATIQHSEPQDVSGGDDKLPY